MFFPLSLRVFDTTVKRKTCNFRKHNFVECSTQLFKTLSKGFSFTSSKEGYPSTDEQLASELLEALTQFMLLFPWMVRGAISSQTPVYAFGESYGGAYVVSLAHVYLQQRCLFTPLQSQSE